MFGLSEVVELFSILTVDSKHTKTWVQKLKDEFQLELHNEDQQTMKIVKNSVNIYNTKHSRRLYEYFSADDKSKYN